MKALVLKEYNKFVLDEVPMPEIGATDVLVAVKACGICGSDVHGMDGSTGRRRPPIVMGHEAAGVIARVGSAVKNWKEGDRVTFDSTIYCGECEHCRRGEVNLCHNRRVLGVSCEDYRQPGAFADYVAVPQHIVYRLPEKLSFEHAALIEPFTIALHAFRRRPTQLNDTVVVIGCGMIGLAIVQVLRNAGCGRIIAARSSTPPRATAPPRSSPPPAGSVPTTSSRPSASAPRSTWRCAASAKAASSRSSAMWPPRSSCRSSSS